MDVIEVTGGRKTYTRWRKPPERALNGLDLTVGEGGVHGFLGPNGSGKTTTIRALLGLVHVDGGEFRLFGQPVPERLPDLIGGVGALVETPSSFPPSADGSTSSCWRGSRTCRRRGSTSASRSWICPAGQTIASRRTRWA